MPTFSRHHDHPTDPDDPRAQHRADTLRDRDRDDEPTAPLPAAGVAPSNRDDADRAAHERRTAEQAADRAEAAEAERAARPVGPRPRASLLATQSLIVGVAAALFVLSGALAGYGIALGVLALAFALGGISATGRRHVAGRTDALIGLVLGLASVVFGILAVTGSLPWLPTDTEPVSRVREWLDAQFVDRF